MADAARCDNCSRHDDRPRPWDRFAMQGERGPLPEGWVRVVARQGNDYATVADFDFEFCSWDCAAERMVRHARTQSRADA